MRLLITFALLLFTITAFAQTPAYLGLNCTGMPATQAAADSVKKGFRGLSALNDKCVWMSGPHGLVGRKTALGVFNWQWMRIAGYEKMDFRTIHAFDKSNCVIATAGTPAAILRTNDGGKNWKEVYRSNDSLMFFDGIGFWNSKRGLIFGDPINGRMFLMDTRDGGKTWKEIPFANCPELVPGEASFAASGTTIRTLPDGHVFIATGGTKSRLWHSRDYGQHWEVYDTPILQGKPSQGIFSIAFLDTANGIIVGGDYMADSINQNICFLTNNGGRSWFAPTKSISGYRSCVEYLDENFLIAVGPKASSKSLDAGITWVDMKVQGNTIQIKPFIRRHQLFGANKRWIDWAVIGSTAGTYQTFYCTRDDHEILPDYD